MAIISCMQFVYIIQCSNIDNDTFIKSRMAWQALENMSTDVARLKFVEEMHRLAPLLKPYVDACFADHLHQVELEKQKNEDLEKLREEERLKEEQMKKEEEERKQQEQTK